MQYKIAQYYLRNFQSQGLSNPCTSRKYKDYKPELMYGRCTSTAQMYSNTRILKYPKGEIMTWQVFSWQDRTSSTSTGAYDIKEQYKVQENIIYQYYYYLLSK